MKTLDQVEARTPLTAGQPGVSINSATGTVTISQSGSYYLTGNVTISTLGAHGIVISAPRVTLDLNGFSLRCITVNGGDGINYGASKGTRIINGIIAGAATQTNGVFSGFGWNRGIVGTGGSTRISNVIVRSVRGVGIEASPANAAMSQVDRCLVETVGGIGIQTAGMVKDSQALNTGSTGIYLPNESLGIFNSVGQSVGTTGSGILTVSGVVSNSRGVSIGGFGVQAVNAMNVHGTSTSGVGVQAENTTNCRGESASNIGIRAVYNAKNCRGTSTSNIGISAVNAANCNATSVNGPNGMLVTGTASFCTASRPGGVALSAPIAIGCYIVGADGTVSSTRKFLGTP